MICKTSFNAKYDGRKMFQRLFILLLLGNVLLFSSVRGRGHSNLTELDDPAWDIERCKRSGVIDSLQKVFNSWFKGTTTESDKLSDGSRKKRKEPESGVSYLNLNETIKETEQDKFIELNENDYNVNDNSYNLEKDAVLTEESHTGTLTVEEKTVFLEEEKDGQDEDDEEEEKIMGKETRKESGNFTELEEGGEKVQDLGELLDLLTPGNNSCQQIETGIKEASTNSYSDILLSKKKEETIKNDVQYSPNQPTFREPGFGITFKSISDRIPYCKEFWSSLGNQLQKSSQKGVANTTENVENKKKFDEPSRQKFSTPKKLEKPKSTEQVIIQASELNFFFLRKLNSEEKDPNKLLEGKTSNWRKKLNMKPEAATGKEELEEVEIEEDEMEGKQDLQSVGKSSGGENEENTDGNWKEIDKEGDGDDEENERILEAMNTPSPVINELSETTQVDDINDYVFEQDLTTMNTLSLVASPKPEPKQNSNQTSVKPWYLKMIPDKVNGTIFSITREHYHSKTATPEVLNAALMKIETHPSPSLFGEDSTLGFPSTPQESPLMTNEISLQSLSQVTISSLPKGNKCNFQSMEKSNQALQATSDSILGTETPKEKNNFTSNPRACCSSSSSKPEEISSTETFICCDWFYKPRFLEIGEAESMVGKNKTFPGKKEPKSRSVVEAWNSFFPCGMPKNKTIRSFWDLWRKVDKINFNHKEGCIFFGDEGKSLPHPMETLVAFYKEGRWKSKNKSGKKTKKINGIGLAALGNESLGKKDPDSIMKIVKSRLKFTHNTQPSVIIYSEPKKIIVSQSNSFINQRNKKYGSNSHNTSRGIYGHSSIVVSENYIKPKLKITTQGNLSMPKDTFSNPIIQKENKKMTSYFRKGFKSNKEKSHTSKAKSRCKKLKMGKNALVASEPSILGAFKSHKFAEGTKALEKISRGSLQVFSDNATLQAITNGKEITAQNSSIGLHNPSQKPLNKLKSQEIYLMRKSLKSDKWNGPKLMETKNVSTPSSNHGINLEIKNNTLIKEEITTNYSALAVSHAQDLQMSQASILAAISHKPFSTSLLLKS